MKNNPDEETPETISNHIKALGSALLLWRKIYPKRYRVS
jgi:hypothetical protein